MATYNNREPANPLGPVAADADSVDLSSSVRFEIGRPGMTFVATAIGGAYHLLCGDGTVVATPTAPPFNGSIRMTLPDGCTHVAMIRATAETTVGCAYRG
jgi:hypothetical protein